MHITKKENKEIRVVPDLKFCLRIRTGSGFGLSTEFRISGRISGGLSDPDIRPDIGNFDEESRILILNMPLLGWRPSKTTFPSLLDPDIWQSVCRIPDIRRSAGSGYPAACLPDPDQDRISENAKIRRRISGVPDIRHNPKGNIEEV